MMSNGNFYFRYIVPFSFSHKESACDTTDYERVCDYLYSCNEWNSEFRWQFGFAPGKTGGDSDTYPFISEAMGLSASKSEPVLNSLGSHWHLQKKGRNGDYTSNNDFLKLTYKDQEETYSFSIQNIQLYLFHTGVGFFLYDACGLSLFAEDRITSKLLKFQNTFKELNHSNATIYLSSRGNTSPQPFGLGIWIARQLELLNCTIQYYRERKPGGSYENSSNISAVPDKALLYTFGILDHFEEGETYTLMERLTRGYSNFYQVIGKKENFYQPFSNIIWHTAKEGCGCFVCAQEQDSFLWNSFQEKVMNEYFSLYILALYQSYSLLAFSETIARNLPSSPQSYYQQTSRYAQELETIENRINVFLLKSVFTSVSFVEQHNGFYNYTKARLRIDEDIHAINEGLHSLTKIHQKRALESEQQKEAKKQHRLNLISGLIGMFAFFSLLLDLFSVVDIFKNVQNFTLANWLIVFLIVPLFTYCAIYFIKNLK